MVKWQTMAKNTTHLHLFNDNRLVSHTSPTIKNHLTHAEFRTAPTASPHQPPSRWRTRFAGCIPRTSHRSFRQPHDLPPICIGASQPSSRTDLSQTLSKHDSRENFTPRCYSIPRYP